MLRVEYVTEDNNGGVYTGIFSLKSKDKKYYFWNTKGYTWVGPLFHTA